MKKLNKPYILLIIVFLALVSLHIFLVIVELITEIKFNPYAEISYLDRKYKIERNHSEGSRDGWDYTVRRITPNGLASHFESVRGVDSPSIDIHSCRSIFQDGEYLVVLDYDYCSESIWFDILIPPLFYAGEIKRFKLI